MKPANDMELGNRFGVSLSGDLPNLIHRHRVCLRIFCPFAERTQSATGHADVGRVDMAVDVEVGDVSVPAFPLQIRHMPQSQNVVAPIHSYAVFEAKTLASFHLLEDPAKAAIFDD